MLHLFCDQLQCLVEETISSFTEYASSSWVFCAFQHDPWRLIHSSESLHSINYTNKKNFWFLGETQSREWHDECYKLEVSWTSAFKEAGELHKDCYKWISIRPFFWAFPKANLGPVVILPVYKKLKCSEINFKHVLISLQWITMSATDLFKSFEQSSVIFSTISPCDKL